MTHTRAFFSGILTIVGILLLALSVTEGWRGWQWRQSANLRGWQAETAYHYLYDPVPGLVGPKGETVRRVDLIDVALADFLQRQQAAKPSAK